MGEGILENPSRGFEIRNWWKRGISADRPENLQLPDITMASPCPYIPEGWVKSSLESTE